MRSYGSTSAGLFVIAALSSAHAIVFAQGAVGAPAVGAPAQPVPPPGAVAETAPAPAQPVPPSAVVGQPAPVVAQPAPGAAPAQPLPPPGAPPYPPPAYAPQPYAAPWTAQQPPPAYGPPPPGYPGGPPGIPAGEGPIGAPPPPLALIDHKPPCCLWSVRVDPFDLIFRRLTVEGEVAWGQLPFTAELTGSWIFDSPNDALDEKGFDLGLNIAWYPGGEPLRGFWVKAHAEFESFDATLMRLDGDEPLGKPNPDLCDADSATGTCKRRVTSPIFGLLLGSTQVFGRKGGFALSGGIGVGAAIADATSLEVQPCSPTDVAAGDPHCPAAEIEGTALGFRYYDDTARVRLLGSLSLGVAF